MVGRRMHRIATRLLSVISLLAALGCADEADPRMIITSQSAYEMAQEAFEKKDYAAAVENYQAALSGGGLFVDLMTTAQLRRAESLARLGKFDEALAILQDQERGSPLLAEIHQVRSFIFERQGKLLDAGQELRKARGYNPSIQKLTP